MAGGHTRGKKKVVTKHQQKRSETNNVSNEEPKTKIMENTSEGIIILKAIESLSTAVLGVKNDIACVKRDVNGVKKELNDKMDTQNTKLRGVIDKLKSELNSKMEKQNTIVRDELADLATRKSVAPVNKIDNTTLQSTVSQMEGGMLNEEQQLQKLNMVAIRVKKEIRSYIKRAWFTHVKFIETENNCVSVLRKGVRTGELNLPKDIEEEIFCRYFKGDVRSELAKLRHNCQSLARRNFRGENVLNFVSF